MKTFTLLCLSSLLPFTTFAVTRTSVANGMWSNPSTWSPAGVPGPADDIVINTSVQYNQNISFGQALFHITAAGSLIDLGTDTIAFGGDFFLVEGYVSASLISVGAVDSVVNYGFMDVSEFAQSGTMFNRAGAGICASMQVLTSDDFTNDGSVSTGMWVNGATVNGNGGQFCISGNFINTAQISGTIDICDASPGGFGDVNTGTIAGSVTYCQAGPCQLCILSSIDEIHPAAEISIVPHPVNETSVVSFTATGNNESDHTFVITDVTGRTVRSITFSGNQFALDRAGMEPGMYFYQLLSENEVLASGKLQVE